MAPRPATVVAADSRDRSASHWGTGAGMRPRTAHFIGIAGAGMSAAAKLLKDSGVTVTGSDEHVYPPVSQFLVDQALPYRTPYAAENIPAGVDLIVIGKNAKLVPETNAEVA